MKRQPQAIHALLDQNNTLAKLQRHSRQLQQLAETVRKCLPPAAARHLLACSYAGSVLTLYARTAAQATALRLAGNNLLQTLNLDQHLDRHQPPLQFNTIRIRISVAQHHRARKNAPATALADNTATLVSELAETLIDPAIKDILRRLSKRRKSQNQIQ